MLVTITPYRRTIVIYAQSELPYVCCPYSLSLFKCRLINIFRTLFYMNIKLNAQLPPKVLIRGQKSTICSIVNGFNLVQRYPLERR